MQFVSDPAQAFAIVDSTENAFAEFCDEVYPRLVGALGLLAGRSAAEDLAQDVLVRLWQHWPKVRGHSNPEAWVFKVGHNLAVSHLRRRAVEFRARLRSGDSELDSTPSVETHLQLTAALKALAPRQRSAVVLRYYADLSIDETAAVMGCAPGTVKALTHSALAHLHGTYGNDLNEGDPADA